MNRVMKACFIQSIITSNPNTKMQSGTSTQNLSSLQEYSFIVCRTTMNSRTNKWSRSLTSLHDT